MDGVSPVGFVLFLAPAFILNLVQLACFVMVIVKMFQQGNTGLAIACIVLCFFGGIGVLVAFFCGWAKSSQWGVKKTMLTWTVCLGVIIALSLAAAVTGPWVKPRSPESPRAPGFSLTV